MGDPPQRAAGAGHQEKSPQQLDLYPCASRRSGGLRAKLCAGPGPARHGQRVSSPHASRCGSPRAGGFMDRTARRTTLSRSSTWMRPKNSRKTISPSRSKCSIRSSDSCCMAENSHAQKSSLDISPRPLFSVIRRIPLFYCTPNSLAALFQKMSSMAPSDKRADQHANFNERKCSRPISDGTNANCF